MLEMDQRGKRTSRVLWTMGRTYGLILSKIGALLGREKQGLLGGSVIKHLPSAQVMIPGSWDRVPHQAPPALRGAYFSLCLSLSVSYE